MRLSAAAQKLLFAASTPGAFTPDEFTLSIADVLKPWQEIDRADIGIVGVPFDTSVMARPGCRFGPNGIRNALALSSTYEVGLDVDVADGITITDFGNVDCVHTDVRETHRRIELVVTEILTQRHHSARSRRRPWYLLSDNQVSHQRRQRAHRRHHVRRAP